MSRLFLWLNSNACLVLCICGLTVPPEASAGRISTPSRLLVGSILAQKPRNVQNKGMLRQLHLSNCYELLHEVLVPVQNGSVKPLTGGFWTSSYSDYSSGWVRWCVGEGYSSNPLALNWHVLTVDRTARLLTVDSLADLRECLKRFPHSPYSGAFTWPDFVLMSKAFDGMRLTERGQVETRLTFPETLYGWDCESTLWFRWKFTRVKRVPAFGGNLAALRAACVPGESLGVESGSIALAGSGKSDSLGTDMLVQSQKEGRE